MMSHTRRNFVKGSVALATSASLASAFTPLSPLLAMAGNQPEPVPPVEDPRLKQMIQRALDAARSAKASYADVRLSHHFERLYDLNGRWVRDYEAITVGVRALVDGFWGFASGPTWSPEEMTRLATEATAQARTNSLGKSRAIELADRPVVKDGHWTTPVAIDPFTIHPSQVADMLFGLSEYVKTRPYGDAARSTARFVKQDKAYGATDGSYFTQRVYRSGGTCDVIYDESPRLRGSGSVDIISPAGVGYEIFDETALRLEADRILEEVKFDLSLPVKPVDVGRYDAVISARLVARLLDGTVGAATELDRALGFEANAGGTSYLNDPAEMLGTYKVGMPTFSVTGNRNAPGGAATVAWDDDAVVPESFPIVTNGMLVDYQTTREGAGWLKDWYGKTSRPVRSHGCAFAPTAVESPLAHTTNLVMAPGTEPHDFEALCASLDKGVAFRDALAISMDFQQLNGIMVASCYEINKGKKTAHIVGSGALFRAPELWKSIKALGGTASARRYGLKAVKGQPEQESYHSVTAVPVVADKLTLIDIMRKA